ncbi:hypothetical protein [Anaerocolumna sp.]|uniref:hypothetical protein n=1 Tax=Anaerocolumna sp. TaxID=2041569 RepID=UPI0028AE3AFB|nr:hypothetical protein [Anaerocolumna sp.]
MGVYEDRVKRLHDHVVAQEKKVAAEKAETTELTNKQIMAMLDEKGIEYDKRANKADLLALLASVFSNDNNTDGAE